MKPLHSLPFLLLFFSFELPIPTLSALPPDFAALLAFKSLAVPNPNLDSWSTEAQPPCSAWRGVACSADGLRVTRLVLQNLSIASPSLRPLAGLSQLRVLSLKSNLISGEIPDLFNLSGLKLLFLSGNRLSGPVPPSISSLSRLYRLDLSFNNLSGAVPPSLSNLSRLLTLRLNSNSLQGPLLFKNFSFPNLQDLNLSFNSLSGAVPVALSAFSAAAFAGNPALCGFPLPSCKTFVSDRQRRPPAAAVVASSPGSKPDPAVSNHQRPDAGVAAGGGGGMSRIAVVLIVVGDFAALVLVSGLLFCYFWRKFARKTPSQLQESEKIVYSSSPYAAAAVGGGGGGFERGRMVFFEGTKRFELEDLLRASAEMLGKGGYGTAYKAVLDDGGVVAVKRLRDVQIGGGKREFDHHMEALGRLRHQNLVPLKAYYYARDEKLLVYDFMPGGSLFSLLHGNRGPGRTPLDWTSRMRIATGSARGLAFIHGANRSPKLTHGNIKSTNILIDKSGHPRLADFGLANLGPPAPARSNGYRAPEAPLDSRRPWSSQKADVYAFGVVLLEILTGKPPATGDGGDLAMNLPRWVQSVVREEWTAEVFDLELMRFKGIEEEMVALLQIAMACVAVAPDQRPRIGHVVKMIEEIRGGEGSPSHESFDSVSDSPCVSDDTGASGSQ